jgi:hypothetical protein
MVPIGLLAPMTGAALIRRSRQQAGAAIAVHPGTSAGSSSP